MFTEDRPSRSSVKIAAFFSELLGECFSRYNNNQIHIQHVTCPCITLYTSFRTHSKQLSLGVFDGSTLYSYH